MTPLRLAAPTLMLALAALCAHAPVASAAASCSGRSHCSEVGTFTAQLTDFRTSAQGNNRKLLASVTFENKTDRPLIIGYVTGSGLSLDEHGNRYTISSDGVRGIGTIERNQFDPRFTLQPGERADARFELGWYAANQIAGVEFQMELAVREIDAVTGNQYRLGREHLVRFNGLRDGLSAAAGTPAAAAPPVAAAAPAAPAPEQADPCAGLPRCQASGPFLAQVTQVTPSQQASNHFVQVRVRFRNLGNQPLILAYQQNSGTLLDNHGQQYTVDWRYQQDVGGIGQVSNSKADPQFVLSPGESRNATFTYRRYVGKTPIGTVFSPSLVVEQLEVLPSKQVRSVREYSLGFSDVAANAGGAAAAQDAGEALKQLKSIFKNKKKD